MPRVLLAGLGEPDQPFAIISEATVPGNATPSEVGLLMLLLIGLPALADSLELIHGPLPVPGLLPSIKELFKLFI